MYIARTSAQSKQTDTLNQAVLPSQRLGLISMIAAVAALVIVLRVFKTAMQHLDLHIAR